MGLYDLTFYDVIQRNAQNFGKRPAWFEVDDERTLTFSDVEEQVDRLACGLQKLGIQKSDAVGIIANNRVEWAVACYATYSLAGRYVPMYEAELEKIWRYIVEDAAVRARLPTDAARASDSVIDLCALGRHRPERHHTTECSQVR